MEKSVHVVYVLGTCFLDQNPPGTGNISWRLGHDTGIYSGYREDSGCDFKEKRAKEILDTVRQHTLV